MRQIVLDTETTGLSPTTGDRLIEVGCVEMVNRKLTGNVFHQYINPEREVSYGAYQVHGISTSFLRDKPKFVDIVTDLKAFIEGAELIIHNAPFDLGFLNFELKQCDDPWSQIEDYCSVIDTLAMARKMHAGQKNNLDALCKRYNINVSHRTKHGALLDSEILAELYLAMTGGQGALEFGSSSTNVDSIKSSKSQTSVKLALDLSVQRASEQEIQDHNAYLEFLSKNKKCLWLE